MLAHLPAPNEKCLVLKGQPCSQVMALLSGLLERHRPFWRLLHVHGHLCNSLGHYRPGVGWEVVSFLSSFSRNRRKPKGRGRKGVSKAQREEDMLFTGRTRNL